MISMMPELFHRLPRNVIQIFTGRNLLYHLLAIILTCLIVESGLDWAYYRSTRSELLIGFVRPAIQLGSLIPILATLAILTFGAIIKNRRLITTGSALGQAALLGYLISIFYKAWTGRIPPPFRGFPRTPIELLSRAFHHVLFDRVKWSRRQAVWPRPKLICSLR
jgi:hypothetical protein